MSTFGVFSPHICHILADINQSLPFSTMIKMICMKCDDYFYRSHWIWFFQVIFGDYNHISTKFFDGWTFYSKAVNLDLCTVIIIWKFDNFISCSNSTLLTSDKLFISWTYVSRITSLSLWQVRNILEVDLYSCQRKNSQNAIYTAVTIITVHTFR